MYLKRLELQGFKSFADKTILEFKPGITSVIGPNGSGKSNISDAIRWVLGEQSMKSLRGAKSEDIIFAGTQSRKSLGFAEVSIVIDNSDAKLPIEYSEVTVTRKLYRNGETGYFINKTPCRLKDILELFMDTGIGKDGYSIIGQGKIDEILSNKSEDRRHIFEEAAGIVKYRTRKQESEKKMEQTKLNLLRINDILTEIEGNIEPLKAQSEKAKQYLNLREELKNIEVGLFVYNINTYKEKLEQIIKDEEIMTSQRNTENEKLTSIQSLKDSLKQELDEITTQIEQMQNIGFESTNKIEKINSEIGISKERIQNNITNKERLESEIKELRIRIQELQEEEKQRQEKKANLFQNKEKFEEELKQKEKEGYIKSVKELLLDCDKNSQLKKGMHGVLANLISVNKEYELAIEMCLGQALQNVVTETEEDAKKLVEHLRNNNLGRASFLPISSIRGKRIENVISNGMKGVIGIASDLVKCDKKYSQIVLNLLGRTVVVEDMNIGISLAKMNNYSFRIVTLKGDVISSSGSITGGSVATKTVNILGRSREIEELEKEIKKLSKKIEEITLQKQKYLESITEVIEKVAGLEKELQDIEIVYAAENQKMVSIEENIYKLEQRRDKLKEEELSINKQKEESIKQKEEKEQEVEKLNSEIKSLSEEVEQFATVNKDNQKYIDDLNFDITNLKISVSSFIESEASIEEFVERIRQEILNNNNNIENKNNTLNQAIKENAELQIKIDNLNSKIEQIKAEVNNSSENIEKLKQLRTEKNELLDKKEEEITNQFSILEGLKEQIVKMDFKKTKLEQDIEQLINTLWNEYEITPNNAGEYKKPNNIAQAQKEVSSIREKIKDLGSINIDSIEEYKKISERYDFMCEQRLDLENTVAKLRKVISEMTQTMEQQFKEKFEIINKNFNEVFIELFGGGKAELILTDEDNVLECGIDIRVQPTGKKLQNMMLLSGGEKAFTAIALLFAILKINPAPFCILDEIEAALDDVNVYRFAEYLKKFSQASQFLVITHRKGTMEVADTVYGVTMEENGISKLLSMKLSSIGDSP